MKRKKNKAFTLIELLVVISLMGILSFIVLASMDSAREKGRDSQMQSQFANLRAQAEKFYNKYNTFGPVTVNGQSGWNLCTERVDGFGVLLTNIADTAGVSVPNTENDVSGVWNKVECHSDKTTDGTDAWAVEAPLSTSKPGSGGSRMLCVDSTGITQQLPTNLKGNSYSCLDGE